MRAICPKPGTDDLCLLAFVNGQRAGHFPVTRWREVADWADLFAMRHKVEVKILPVTGREYLGFHNLRWQDLQGVGNPSVPDLLFALNNLRELANDPDPVQARRAARLLAKAEAQAYSESRS
ncbi:hypothetical protein [Novosphingobium humi]|uniref:hypothetical protein n=1 Tax=Novosphingobium humi TaxID=2282397 RepID=UPI0025B0C6FC|nr:hypothetical protein [Novosphingobium humi]WJS98918.1 hypothetical protein NYQ05_01820 [Novosphingobium humi]